MAAQKPKPRKKTQKKTTTSSLSVITNLKKIFWGFVLLIFLVVSAGFLTRYLVIGPLPEGPIQTRGNDQAKSSSPASIPHHKKTASLKSRQQTPVFEIYSEKKVLPPSPVEPPLPSQNGDLPCVAIIIDDMGYDVPISEQLLDLEVILTFAILPYSPHLNEIAQAAHSRGIEIMLHLPMEPLEYPEINPGPGALLADMPPDQLVRQLNNDLDAVPYIVGVNNHMGSKITSISTKMYQIFTILKKRNLFFIDSRTTTGTLCRPSARLLQIPFGQRDVFLDHLQTPEAIRRQIRELVRVAEKNGQAIGIGHPYSITCNALRQELPFLRQKVKLVTASRMVHILG